jgi:hypothetical protein
MFSDEGPFAAPVRYGTVAGVARSLLGMPPRPRRRIASTFIVIPVGACLVAATLLLSRAEEEQRVSLHALGAPKALSFDFDQ